MAIRLNFITMKKILILIFVYALCGISYAQDMKITFSGNNATITIGEKTFDSKHQIDVRKETKSISIVESPKLSEKHKHYVKINGSKVTISQSDINLADAYSYTLANPFTLKYSDVITVYRDSNLCGTFYVESEPISKSEVLSNVKFNTADIKSLKQGEKMNVEAELETSINIILENVKILKNNKEITSDFKDNRLKFELSLDDNEKSADIKVIYDIKGQSELKGLEYSLYTIEKVPSSANFIWYLVGGISSIILLGIIFFAYWFLQSTRIRFTDKKTLRLIIGKNGEISKGNKSLSSGTFEGQDGLVFKLKKQKWYSIFSRVYFIGVKISCSNNKSFILEDCQEPKDHVGLVHYDNGIVDRIIAVGMKAASDGIYVLEDKSEITIKSGEIYEIKKLIVSTRNTTHYITLNSEEPQVNDLVTPKNNKKQYVIDTTDGIRFEIFNNRIQKISTIANTSAHQIELVATNGKTIIVIPKGDVPAEGDIAIVAEGEYIVGDTVYVIEEGKIKSITSQKETPYSPAELSELVKQLKEENRKLQSRPTQESFDLLKEQNSKVNAELIELKKKYEDVDKAIEEAKKEAKTEEKRRLDALHKKDIIDNYISLSEHKQKLNKSDKLVKDAVEAKEKSDRSLKQKETELTTASGKISDLEKTVHEKQTEIIAQKAAIAKLKEVAQKKNVHFVYQVQDTLEEISNTFKDVYKDMTNATIKDGFISPMLKGVSGLGTGILSWAEDYAVKVKGDSEGFFGGDFMTMKEEDVKETISKKFISNIVKSDSFSKFVRLYQLSSVPFIRKQLIDAGMNIEVLNKLYYKVYVLVSEFGYQIICPRLFEEQHSDKKYQWFNSTNLFNIIDLPEEEKKAIKKLGSETIVDVNQIGFISPWASRNATAVTPDF